MTLNKLTPNDTTHLIRRLRRIGGQVAALEEVVETGASCEEVVTQAYAIEKAVASLIMAVLNDYFNCQVCTRLEQEPEAAQEEIRRLFQLVNRWTVGLQKDN